MNKDYQNYTANLPEIKDILASAKIESCLNKVKEYLPDFSPKYDLLILLITGYNRIKADKIKGILSMEEENQQLNKLTDRILNFLNQISEKDFVEPSSENEKDPRVGKVKYSIPQKMQINEETECSVWIAFDEATLLKEAGETEGEVKDVRVSKVMGVELICHGKGDAFNIETYDETEQVIEKDFATSWSFYVTPLKEGKHPLILKISVIIAVDGEKVNKTKVLREIVQITTEKPKVTEGQIAEKEAKGFLLMAAAGTGTGGNEPVPAVEKAPTSSTIKPQPKPPVKEKSFKTTAAIIGILSIILVAFWLNNGSESKDAKDDLEIIWNQLKESTDTLEIQEFIAKNPDSKFIPEANGLLEKLREQANPNQPIDTIGMSSPTDKETEEEDDLKASSNNKEEPTSNVQKTSKADVKVESEPEPPTDETAKEEAEIEEVKEENKATEDNSVSYKDVSRKPLYKNCERRKKSKQNECTEDAIEAFIRNKLAVSDVELKGSVSLNFLIDKDGNVDKVTILEENNPKLAQKAKQIIEQMPRFKPGQNALGVPVSVLYKVPIRFKN